MAKNLRFNLALLRAARGKLTQREVAEATGLSQKTISALETGASKGVEFSTIAKLCDYLKCSPNDLLVLEEEVEYIPVSQKSLTKADKIIARGLRRAMEAPPRSAEEIWADFDKVRAKIQAQVHSADRQVKKKSRRA
ncbi:MAG: helix-turn-helix transcriptional regulator [Candidatus Melainabacteria bacterium]|nr:helix-turn-helix transcriptional regulator [Candidatus Melainabacteria bacterium]